MVIQRWQSVLLLVAVVMMGLFSFMSLGQVQTADFSYNFTALGLCPEGIPTSGETPECVSTWYLFAVSLLSGLLSLVAIFTFKQYKLQKRMCFLTMLLLCCVICISAIIGYNTIDGASVSWSSIVCAPFISLIAVIMAEQRIVADHRKIQAVDRFRD
ncbi:MAG: DUF4293 domain-containing protein [Muribaculaceae bacterium]|nr:DUF4293 domain-containing protein [Muribaculaceae bacterium]